MTRLLVALVGALLLLAPAASAQTIAIDGADLGREFDGVGAVSAGASTRLLYDYPEPARSQVLDYLFKPGYGASLQLLKVEIGGDTNSTDGAEASHLRTPGELDCNRGYEWWLMKEAKRRNPHIKLLGLEWGAPSWFDGGFWSQDNVDYLLAWLDCAERHGLDIDYMGGWNEHGFDAGWYVAFGEALERTHPDVEIVAADECCRADLWRVADALATDPAFKAAVDVVGVHFPCGNREARQRCTTTDTARGLGLPLWASENSSQSRDVGAEPIARALNRMYIDAEMTGFMSWSAVSAWYASLPIADTGLITAEWPWSGFYDVGKSVWAKAHTTQFTRPGWRYLDTGSARHESGATYVSRVSPTGRDFTTVIEAMDVTGPTTLQFEQRNLPRRPLWVWETDLRSDDPRDHLRRVDRIETSGGRFSLTVEPGHVYSVTTTTGQGKGRGEPRATVDEQLRLPFRERFDRHPGRLARYFSDLNGGFETAPCDGGRRGGCYRQVVEQQPIAWNAAGSMPPTTVAGDPRWWGDYEVSADAMLEEADYVELLGRVESQRGVRVSGYHLRLTAGGEWTLYSEDLLGENETLASGVVDLGSRPWHRLELRFRGNRITVAIDRDTVASVEDDGHRTGQIGLRTSPFQPAQFDDVEVEPTGPRPEFAPQRHMTATATSEHTANNGGYEHSVPNAIDGRPETMWSSLLAPAAPLPQALTLDLGRRQRVEGLTYQPRLDGSTRGMITAYDVLVSDDGSSFRPVASGTWPLSTGTKVVRWPDARARYLRLVATGSGGCAESGSAAVSELNVVTDRAPEPTGSAEDSGPGFDAYVPHDQMTATASSIYGAGYEAPRAIDGDCRTFWHTAPGATRPLPATLTLDLGGEWDVEGITYLPRQDGNGNGLITGYNVYVSSDGATFTKVAGGTWAGDALMKAVRWAPTRARYLRLEATAGTAGVASVATLDVAVAGDGPP
jgi:O-glycosyl hydrolase